MKKSNKANMYVDIQALHPEVTGSCLLCTVRLPNKERIKFLVDCGLFQEEQYNSNNYSFPFDPKDIEFVLSTHTHIDHIGRIPLLYKKGFEGKVYTSCLASDLMPIALYNTAEILSTTSQKNLAKRANVQHYDGSKPLYDSKDVSLALRNVIGKSFNVPFNVNDNVTVTFIPNGHCLGASSILVSITYIDQDPIHLYFSGDYSNSNAFFDVKGISKALYNLPINLVTESTYGTTSRTSITKNFEDLVIESMNNHETLVITAFAFERMQHIENVLKSMQDKGTLSKSIQIYSDGKLAHQYDSFFSSHLKNLKVKDFKPCNMVKISDAKERERVLASTECKIILTTSGMGNYGPAQVYLPYYIAQDNCSIIFGGYTAENTLGRKLQNLKNNEVFELNGIHIKKKAKVYHTTEFSSHAKQEDLLDFIMKFNNLKSVLINHGQSSTKNAFLKAVIDEVNPKSPIITTPTNTYRIGTYGILKVF